MLKASDPIEAAATTAFGRRYSQSEGHLDFLTMFDSPLLNFCIGGFFLIAGAKRGKRRPPGSLSSGAASTIFAIVGLLLIANGLYLWHKFGLDF